jgi:hypothetical protein
MTYSQSDTNPHPLDGILQEYLFDELFVHDGQNLNMFAGEKGIYPAVADSIALWIDSKSRESRLDEWRNRINQVTREQQNIENRLHIGGMGIHQYRLPFADILEVLTGRFSREVLRQFLIGGIAGEPRLGVDLSQEHYLDGGAGANDPQKLAIAFLQEGLGGEPRLSKQWRFAFNRLALGSKENEGVNQSLRGLRYDPKTDLVVWKEWLNNVVLLFLNGRNTKLSAIAQRGGKLGLALEFLKALSSNEQRSGRLALMQKVVQDVTGSNEHSALQGLQDFGAYVEQLTEQLSATAVALGATNTTPSLYQSLRDQLADLNQITQELQSIRTRTYILQDANGQPFVDSWYTQYMQAHIETAIRQFYWRASGDGFVLTLCLPEKQIYEFDPHDQAGFVHALERLADYFAVNIRASESLGTVLNVNQLRPDQLPQTAQNLLDKSGVMLNYQSSRANSIQHGFVLATNPTIEQRQAHQLQDLLMSLSNIHNVHAMQTSDPYSLSFIRHADTLPDISVTTISTAIDQYNGDERLAQNPQIGGYMIPTPIFAAEANALFYERQLVPKLQIPRRLLNPVVVSGLTVRAIAEVYLLAATMHDQPGDLKLSQDLRFESPEWQRVLIEAERMRMGMPHGPLMLGLFQLLKQLDIATAERILRRYMNNPQFGSYWDEWESSNAANWRQHKLIRNTPATILDDLIDITVLIILDVLGDES